MSAEANTMCLWVQEVQRVRQKGLQHDAEMTDSPEMKSAATGSGHLREEHIRLEASGSLNFLVMFKEIGLILRAKEHHRKGTSNVISQEHTQHPCRRGTLFLRLRDWK